MNDDGRKTEIHITSDTIWGFATKLLYRWTFSKAPRRSFPVWKPFYVALRSNQTLLLIRCRNLYIICQKWLGRRWSWPRWLDWTGPTKYQSWNQSYRPPDSRACIRWVRRSQIGLEYLDFLGNAVIRRYAWSTWESIISFLPQSFTAAKSRLWAAIIWCIENSNAVAWPGYKTRKLAAGMSRTPREIWANSNKRRSPVSILYPIRYPGLVKYLYPLP
jgi:hypothetical protein